MLLSDIATQLLLHNIQKIFILGRSKKKFMDALEHWHSQGHLDSRADDSRLCFVECDLADIHSVKDSTDQIIKATDRLDIVICNAGMASLQVAVLTHIERRILTSVWRQ
jgi:NAD(P)-dependent dehydrogenase (short-subunit alcohol dehydrogenase family)